MRIASNRVSRRRDALLAQVDVGVSAVVGRVDEGVLHPVPAGLRRRIRAAGVRIVEVGGGDALQDPGAKVEALREVLPGGLLANFSGGCSEFGISPALKREM
jgi:hypothetical protein